MAVGLDTVVYSLLKKYTDNSIRGITGALAGKNCTIESVSKQDGLTTVTFKWTADDGTARRTQIEVEDGTPIYTWTSGNHYEYGDLVIYASMFYRCITDNSDVEFDDTKWNELGSPDGNYDIVQNVADLPSRFTSADRKLYYVINDNDFYLWNGHAWVKVMSNSLEELEDVNLDELADDDVLVWDATNNEWVNKQALLQYSTMPTASASLEGRVVQFVGETIADYVNGSFYKCVAKGTSPETYEWKLTMPDADTLNVVAGHDYVQREFTYVDGKFIQKNGAIGTLSSFMYSNPISVRHGDKIKFVGRGYLTNVAMISTCNSDGTSIQPRVISIDSDTHTYEYTVDEAEYIIVSSVKVADMVLYISRANEIEDIEFDLLKNKRRLANTNICHLFKKVVCIGDSYMQGFVSDGTQSGGTGYTYSWVTHMARMTGNPWVNLASGGQTTKSWYNSQRVRLVHAGEGQAYIIGLGINDAQNGLAVGTVDDIGTDADTYYAWMSKIVLKIIEFYPNAYIIINTCPSHLIATRIAPYNVAVRDIVNHYKDTIRIHCLDLADTYADIFYDENFTKNFESAHPTALGHAQIARMYEYALSDYMNKHYKEFESLPWTEYINKITYTLQIDELPTPSSTWLDKIYLLTSDQTGYLKGGIYQCVVNSGVYSWELISGSNEYYGTEEEWEALSRAEQDRYDFVRIHGDEEVINLGKYLEKVTVMPQANAENVNRVVLLVANQSGYNVGGIYKCISDGGDPATYSWELISSADMVEFTQQELEAMW